VGAKRQSELGSRHSADVPQSWNTPMGVDGQGPTWHVVVTVDRPQHTWPGTQSAAALQRGVASSTRVASSKTPPPAPPAFGVPKGPGALTGPAQDASTESQAAQTATTGLRSTAGLAIRRAFRAPRSLHHPDMAGQDHFHSVSRRQTR
jgi:hypothetical protein